MDQLVTPTYLGAGVLKNKAEAGLSPLEEGYYVTAWLAPNGELGLGPAMTQKLKDLKHELQFTQTKGGTLTEEEKAVLNMTESELFERGATLMNEIMMNSKKMNYDRGVFSKDLTKSERLTAVSASGTGMQKEPGRPKASKGMPAVVQEWTHLDFTE